MKNIIRAVLIAGFLAVSCQPAAAAVTLVKALMSTSPNDQNCNPGPTVTSFPNTTTDAWLYFEVTGASVGDQVHVDFIAPSGQLYVTDTFDPLTISGTVCFSASVHIAGASAANLPGNWSARGIYNGSQITSQAFTITGQPTNCVYAVNPLTVSAAAAGGPASIAVSTVTGCQWTAVTNSSFITITSGASGTGNGSVNYSVAANNTSGSRTGTLTVAGQTVTITQAAPVSCAYAINPLSANVPNAGGTGSIAVSTTAGCQWTAVSNANFITITSGATGTGNGTANYSVTANTGPARSGTITVAGQTFTVTQTTSQITLGQPFFVDGRANAWAAGRSTAFSGLLPPSYRFTAGPGKVITFPSVTGTAECSSPGSVCPNMTGPDGVPNNSGSNGVLSAVQGISGRINRTTGYEMVGVFLDDNAPDGTPPESLDFTNNSFTKINPKIGQIFFIGDGLSGTGSGTQQQFFVPPSATRVFIGLADGVGAPCCYDDNLGGFTVTMNMSSGATPCSYSLSPNPVSVPGTGGPQSVTVNTQTGCFWSSTVNDSWLTVNPNASSNGTGPMPFTAAALSGTAPRTGTILIADQTLTVNQSAPVTCSFAVNPLTASVPQAGGSGSLSVIATANSCPWTATANSSFLSITSGATGTGNGTVNYSATANTTTSSRTGTLTVAGQTVTITQPGVPPCSYAINPPSASAPAAGGTGSVTVSTTSTCAWTAVSNAQFLTVTSGASGTGNGAVNYTVAANSGASRSGTITIAGQTFTVNQSSNNITAGTPFFVDGKSNLYVSGSSTAFSGLVPPVLPFSAGSGQVVTFSNVSGTWSCGPAPTNGPDGSNACGTTNINSRLGISGIIHRGSAGFLAGVFLDDSIPSGTPPERLDFTDPTFTKINPKIGQAFFIGDGLSLMGAGTQQQFFVPPTATRLFLGFADGFGVQGDPGFYDDNTGGFTVTVNLTTGGPPCSYSLAPNPFNVPNAGGPQTVTVNTQTGCFWSSTVLDNFITITPNASSNGTGPMPFNVAANDSGTRTGKVLVADQTLSVVQSPTGGCTFTLSATSASPAAAGGTATVGVTASSSSCTYAVASNASFITVTSGPNGTGSGTVNYTVAANTGAARSGTITIAGQTFTVNQAAASVDCLFALSPNSQNVGAAGGSFTVRVSTTPGCTWTASSNSDFLTITSGATGGNGDGNVGYTVAAYSGTQARTGTLTIAGVTFTVTQAGTAPCTFTLDKTSATAPAAGNSGTVQVTASAGTCSWSATPSVPWITISSGSTGTGNGTVNYTVAANTGTARTGTITIAGQTFTVSQDGAAGGGTCTFTLTVLGNVISSSTPLPSIPAAGGDITVQVQASAPTCTWTASSTASFITIKSGAPGTGNGPVVLTAAANTGAARTGNVTIAGQTFTVSQDAGTAGSCTYTFTPPTGTAPAAGGDLSVQVTASASTCTWTATPSVPWITLKSGSPGTGDGTIGYSVQANTGSARNGTIALSGPAGQGTFTVNQGSTQISLGQPFFVDGRANLWAAGRSTAPTGLLPPTFRFPAGSGQVLTFSSVTGTAECSSPGSVCPTMSGPDGIPVPDLSGAGLNAVQGISGFLSRSFGFAMFGVFLDDNAPDGTPPESLDFTDASFTKINPKIGQVFFIGDGLSGTGAGTQQQFFIPPTATRIFIGLADGIGAPCCYDDNLGGFNVTMNINPGGPPCSYTLDPTTVNAPPAGGPLSSTVNTQTGCFWSSTVKDSWIKVKPNASSNGTGKFSFSADPVGGSARTGTVLLADQTLTVTQKQAIACTYTLSPTSATAPGTGGTGSVSVTANDSSCMFSATVDQAWITVTSGSTGTGSGAVTYSVSPNTGPARTGTIHIGGQVFTINQAATAAVSCTFTLTPTTGTQPAAGGTGSFQINPSAASCTWTATANASWLTITAGSSGTGPGTVSYSATANTGAARTGTITAGGQTFTVSQDAAPPAPCTYTLSPAAATAPAAGNTGSVSVATGSTCQWTATSNATWITINGTASGTGNGTFSYTVAANTGTARTGTIAVSGQTFTVTQDAGTTSPCTYTLNPASQAALPAGGPGQVLVVTDATCKWTAVSNNDFITITGGATGTGTQVVNYTVTANTGASSRSGSITIGGVNFPITQPNGTGGDCNLTLSPTSETVQPAGGPGQFAITAPTGCPYTATPNVPWITITSGGSGNGSGTVNYTVAANTGAARDGTITIGSQTYTVHQEGGTAPPCTYALTPTSQAAAVTGGPGTVQVTTTGGCTWTAASGVDWVTISSGATGNGNGSVTYSVAANTGPARNGTLTIAGQPFTVNQAGTDSPAQSACSYQLSPMSQSATAAGGPGQVVMATATGCSWTATSDSPWITVTAGAQGSGGGTITYSVAANTGAARNGIITAGGKQFPIMQAASGNPGGGACTYTLNPSSQAAKQEGGAAQFAVAAATGCTFTATSSVEWITITSGGTGTGSGTVNYSVAPNTGAERTGTISLAGVIFTVTQAGTGGPNAPCTFSVSPTSQGAKAEGGTAQASVTTSTGCTWTATSNVPWITITQGANGSGSGSVLYNVAPNTDAATRTGTMTIAGQTFTVNQAGTATTVPCTYSLNPTSQAVDGAGGPGQFLVNTITGCTWTAASDSDWLTITTGATGNGTAVVTYAVAAFTGTTPRTGNIKVADKTFSVTQTSGTGGCTPTLNPTSQAATAGGGPGQVAVTEPTGCSFTATSTVPWLTITTGATGNGSGTLVYSAAPNTGAARMGAITVSGATFTVNQAASDGTPGTGSACTYSLSSTSQSATVGGGSSQVMVTTAAGCMWTATSNADWITLTSGANGNGNGTLVYSVAPNSGAASRTGTMTIAGQTFTVTQAGTATPGGGCTYTLSPSSGSADPAGGSGQVLVATSIGCAWTATSNADWIRITSGGNGSGTGTLTYTVDASSTPRTGTLTIAGQTYTVNQGGGAAGGCTYSLNPTSTSAKVAGGTGQVAVTTAAGCQYTATSSADWITISAGATGSGAGTVTYNVAANSGAASRMGTLTIAGQSFQVTQDGTSTPSSACTYSLNPASGTATPGGGSDQVTVTTAVGCTWTATSNADWITTSGATGSGTGTFNYTVAPNKGTSRTGTVAVNGSTFTVMQGGTDTPGGNGCTYSINPASQSAASVGGPGQAVIVTATGCSYTVSSAADFISVTNGATGNGSGTVTYTVASNTGGAARTGILMAGGQNLTITQAGTGGGVAGGNGACSFSVTPQTQSANAAGGAGNVSVIAPVGCTWSSVSAADWITITNGASGTGNGTVNYSAAPNPGAASRTGTLTVAGQTVTVTQGGSGSAGGGCTYAIAPVSQPSTASGGTGQAAVTAGAGCTWTAAANAPFITVTSGGGGSANDIVTYSVAANTAAASRTGTLTIAGQTLTVTQAGSGPNGDNCTFSIAPASQSITGAASGQIAVTAPLGCTWQASSGVDWVAITGGATGSGSGVVTFGAAANTGDARSGTLTIAGQPFTVNQAAGSAGGPAINAGGVVNAASFAAPDSPGGAVARGSFITIFGTNLGPAAAAIVTAYPLAASLAGVSMRITQGSTSVDLIPHFVSPNQVNAILPSNAPVGTVQLTLTYQGVTSAPVTFQVSETNFGIFTLAGGTGPGIIQNVVTSTDYRLNLASESAHPGQIEILWGTGLGAINGPDNMPPPVGDLATQVQVLVGGKSAPISYKGRSPGNAAVDNVYFTVPADAPTGCAVPVQIILNGSTTSNTATMAISASGSACPK